MNSFFLFYDVASKSWGIRIIAWRYGWDLCALVIDVLPRIHTSYSLTLAEGQIPPRDEWVVFYPPWSMLGDEPRPTYCLDNFRHHTD